MDAGGTDDGTGHKKHHHGEPLEYDQVPGLAFFHQPKVLRGLYSIVLVSLLMSVFETLFYKFIIEPSTTSAAESIHKSLDKAAYDAARSAIGRGDSALASIAGATKQAADRLAETGMPLEQQADLDLLNSYLTTAAQRERVLLERLNLYAYITGSFVVFFLAAFLGAIHNRLYDIRDRPGVGAVFGPDFRSAILTALLTVLCLGAFQIVFYIYGLKFNFVGTAGLEEVVHLFNNSLRAKLGQPLIQPTST